MPCRAEKREKDTKWQPTNVKNVYGRTDIKKDNFFVS
jgi:hypothetical protein